MAKRVHYTKEAAIQAALPYSSKTDFRIKNKALYSYANKRGWWPEMSAHMDNRAYPVKWNETAVMDCARSFARKISFQKEAPGAYAAARSMGILDRVCAHMERRLAPHERAQARCCKTCKIMTHPSDFAGNSNSCNACHSKRTAEYARKNPAWKASTVAKRRARLARAIPPWVGRDELRAIQSLYDQAKSLTKQTGVPHEVDHIYPLAGKTVCGLHVFTNLRVVTLTENRKKSNKVQQ